MSEQSEQSERLPGLVTTSNWLIMPNGEVYHHLFCREWSVVPDRAFPVDGFRSTEHWQLFGYFTGVERPLIILPGCEVKSFVFCPSAPKRDGIFDVNKFYGMNPKAMRGEA